jgi:hypothetical protein
MKHYMQYHNADKMGYGCAGITVDPLSIITQKPVPDIRGDVVWIICGEGKPRRYGICARFVVTTIDVEPGEGTTVSGEGTLLEREIPLNNEPWLKRFLADYQNFSLGFREVKEREYIEQLERLLVTASGERYQLPRGSSALRVNGRGGTVRRALDKPSASKPTAQTEAPRTPQPSSVKALHPGSADRDETAAARSNTSDVKDEPLEIFIAYSHKDEEMRDAIVESLKFIARSRKIIHWHDRKIAPGDEWQKEIDKNLSRAHIILLLISRDFLVSDYCHDIELDKAMRRHTAGEAIVVPIIARPCDWQLSQFTGLQVLPKDGRPVTDWNNKDTALLDIERGLRRVIDGLRSGPRTP